MRRPVLLLLAALPLAFVVPSAHAVPGLGGCASAATLKPTARTAGGGGTLQVTARITCDNDMLELAVDTSVLRNGKPVQGLAGDAACSYVPGMVCAELAAEASGKVTRGMAGTYVVRTTTTIAGPSNAMIFAVSPAPPAGCTYDEPSLSITCVGEQRVVVK